MSDLTWDKIEPFLNINQLIDHMLSPVHIKITTFTLRGYLAQVLALFDIEIILLILLF